MTVVLLTLAAFLLVLALLADQLEASATPVAPRPVVVLRKVYETRYVETRRGPSTPGAGGTSVTQSVSNAGSTAVSPAAPTTRSS